jgi:hypothetical protein
MKTPKKTIPEFVQRAESMLPMFKTSSNRPQPTADLPREICRAASQRWSLFPVPDYYRYAPMKVRKGEDEVISDRRFNSSSCNAFKYPVSGWV